MCSVRLLGFALVASALVAPPALTEQVQLNVALGHSVLQPDSKQTTYLKVGLTGFRMEGKQARSAVNVAIVIDTSGSMQGEKIQRAREAALMAIDRFSSRDIACVVTYSDTASVLVPATRLTDKEPIRAAIRGLEAGGSTALFAGVSKGAGELRKFLEREYVNRVILISDGIANVGPSSPAELGDLGASLVKEGVSVTTIGLGTGYNEDLMRQLAVRSDGNHYFAENGRDLAQVFDGELGDVLSVVAQEVTVKIRCADGIRPIRVLGREADITGQEVRAFLNQLYSEQEKYVLLEVEVPATASGKTLPVAKVEVSYANMQTKTTDDLSSAVAVRFSGSEAEIEKGIHKDVMVSVVEQIGRLNSELAVKLRDGGKVDEAKKLLLKNFDYLRSNADKYESKDLERYAKVQAEDADNLDEKNWTRRRKEMVEDQVQIEVQQRR